MEGCGCELKFKVRTSLVIPTFNKANRLKLTLQSLTQLKVNEGVEVIVVDDGSTDQTSEILDYFSTLFGHEGKLLFRSIRILHGGRSVARNKGAEVAKGELLIFSDDDLILHPMFICAHEKIHEEKQDQALLVHGCIYDLPFLKFFSDPQRGQLIDGTIRPGLLRHVITPELVKSNRTELERRARLTKFEKDIHELLHSTDEYTDSRWRWVCCTGGNISVRKNLFIKVGGFDENMGKRWGCEDLELGYRLYQSGARFALAIDAINYHLSHFRKNYQEDHLLAFEYFIRKHPDPIIRALLEYFEKRIPSLLDWWKITRGK